ncbi:hypothetical protein ABIB73_004401 [Bradyrhizobium sp. F1.4.3]
MSDAEGSSRQHFSRYVDSAGEPCGGQRMRVRQNRVVLAVVATAKLSRRRKRARPGELRHQFVRRGRPEGIRLPGERGISRQPTAQGRPCDWLHLYAAVRSFCAPFRAADRGCQPAPGLPCALLIVRVERRGKARAKCAARLRSHVCDRKRTQRWIPLSCPGRSAALLQRCAAEPGPIYPRGTALPSGSNAISAFTRVFDALWGVAARPGHERECGTVVGVMTRLHGSPNSTPACCPGCPVRTSARRSRNVRRFR